MPRTRRSCNLLDGDGVAGERLSDIDVILEHFYNSINAAFNAWHGLIQTNLPITLEIIVIPTDEGINGTTIETISTAIDELDIPAEFSVSLSFANDNETDYSLANASAFARVVDTLVQKRTLTIPNNLMFTLVGDIDDFSNMLVGLYGKLLKDGGGNVMACMDGDILVSEADGRTTRTGYSVVTGNLTEIDDAEKVPTWYVGGANALYSDEDDVVCADERFDDDEDALEYYDSIKAEFDAVYAFFEAAGAQWSEDYAFFSPRFYIVKGAFDLTTMASLTNIYVDGPDAFPQYDPPFDTASARISEFQRALTYVIPFMYEGVVAFPSNLNNPGSAFIAKARNACRRHFIEYRGKSMDGAEDCSGLGYISPDDWEWNVTLREYVRVNSNLTCICPTSWWNSSSADTYTSDAMCLDRYFTFQDADSAAFADAFCFNASETDFDSARHNLSRDVDVQFTGGSIAFESFANSDEDIFTVNVSISIQPLSLLKWNAGYQGLLAVLSYKRDLRVADTWANNTCVFPLQHHSGMQQAATALRTMNLTPTRGVTPLARKTGS